MSFNAALILSTRAEFKNLYRAALKDRGFLQIDIMSSVEDVERYLRQNKSFLAVFDWQLGEKQVVFGLDTIMDISQGDVATIVQCDSTSGQAIAVGCEFNVDHLSCMGLVQSEVKTSIIKALESNQRAAPIRKILRKSAELKKQKQYLAMFQLLSAANLKLPSSEAISIELAATEVELGKWADAKVRLSILAKSQPPLLRAQHLLARCLMHSGDFIGAEKMLRHTKLLNPHNASRLADLGHAIFVQGNRLSEASSLFDQALELEPDNKSAHLGKSGCLLTQGDIEGGMELIKDSVSTRELASIFNIAAVLNIRKGKYQDGYDLYQYAINAVRGDNDALARLFFNTGLGLKRWRKFEEAKIFFSKSHQLDPNFGKAKSQLEAAQKPSEMPAIPTGSLPEGAVSNQRALSHVQKFSDFDDLGEKSLGFSGFDEGDVDEDES